MRSILDTISYHAVYDASIQEAILYAKGNGFTGIQIADESPHLSFERLSAKQADELKIVAQEQGVYIVLHAADDAASLFQPNRYLIAGIRDYYTALLNFAHKVSARLVTIHSGEMTTFRTDSQPEHRIPREDLVFYHKVFSENLDFLLSINNAEVPICVESYNLDQATLDMIIPYLERGDVFLCWDIAKSFGQPYLEDFFFKHIPWVRQVHLHDRRLSQNDLVKTHCVIGTGEIDFGSYLQVLSKANVQDFCIEVRPRDKARESLIALKKMINDSADIEQ